MNIRVTYLLNSGFTVEIKDVLLIFDYYKDENFVVKSLISKYKKVYFFVSHRHFDHYNPEIFNYSDYVSKYILSYDVKPLNKNNNKSVYMNEYDSAKIDDMLIKSYSSTDEGISYSIEIYNKIIFHAGDFNWWHWKGDTEKNIAFARNGFQKQLKKFIGSKFDLVFFPVDGRLEEYMDIGIKHFADVVTIKNLITMHNVNNRAWNISNEPSLNKIKKIYIPNKTGEVFEFSI